MRTGLWSSLVCLVLFSCGHAPVAPSDGASATPPGVAAGENWRASMQGFAGRLRELEPYLYDAREFDRDVNRKHLTEKIHDLAVESSKLTHVSKAADKDPTIKYVAAKFAERIARAERHFGEGNREMARDYLIGAQAFCVQCHVSSPGGLSTGAQPEELGFFVKLSSLERARYYVARRNFASGYGILYQTLGQRTATASTPRDLVRGGNLALQTSAQHLNDRQKTVALIERIEANVSLPAELREQNLRWKKSLASWKGEVAPGEAEGLIERRGSELDVYRALPALMKDLRAATDGTQRSRLMRSAAHAYRALGSSAPTGLEESYLEGCIRESPHTDIARSCYTEFEEGFNNELFGDWGRVTNPLRQKLTDELKGLAE